MILSGPDDASEAEGATATFAVVAIDARAYQWQRSQDGGLTFAAVAGATAANYTTPPLTAEDYSGNQFRVVVFNSVTSITSRAAVLTVTVGVGPE